MTITECWYCLYGLLGIVGGFVVILGLSDI